MRPDLDGDRLGRSLITVRGVRRHLDVERLSAFEREDHRAVRTFLLGELDSGACDLDVIREYRGPRDVHLETGTRRLETGPCQLRRQRCDEGDARERHPWQQRDDRWDGDGRIDHCGGRCGTGCRIGKRGWRTGCYGNGAAGGRRRRGRSGRFGGARVDDGRCLIGCKRRRRETCRVGARRITAATDQRKRDEERNRAAVRLCDSGRGGHVLGDYAPGMVSTRGSRLRFLAGLAQW